MLLIMTKCKQLKFQNLDLSKDRQLRKVQAAGNSRNTMNLISRIFLKLAVSNLKFFREIDV